MSDLIIKIDVIAGADLNDTAKQMKELAGITNCIVSANFSGVKLYVRRDGSLDVLHDNYIKALSASESWQKQAWSH